MGALAESGRTGSSFRVKGDPLADCSCSVATDKRRAAYNMLALRISEGLLEDRRTCSEQVFIGRAGASPHSRTAGAARHIIIVARQYTA